MEKPPRDGFSVVIGARANRSVLHYTNTNEEFSVDGI